MIEFSLQIINYSTKTDRPLIPRLMSDLGASRGRTNREGIYKKMEYKKKEYGNN